MCLSGLLPGVTPHSGVCVPERVVARSSSTLRCVCACVSCCQELLHTQVCVCLSELLLGVPPHSGMCVPGSYSTLDSLSTFIACLYVAVMIFLYVCLQFVYNI